MSLVSLSHDVTDFYGARSSEDDTVAAKHALAFGRTWLDVFGCTPPGSVHNAYCGDKCPDTPNVDAVRFAQFVTDTMRIAMPRCASPTALADFVASLEDADTLRKQIITKLAIRYSAGDPDTFFAYSLSDARNAMIHKSAALVASPFPLDVNPSTGHYVGPVSEGGEHIHPIREAWNSVASRDALLYAQSAGGTCLFIDSAVSGYRIGAAAVAKEMSAASGSPLVVLSDCRKALAWIAEDCDFYHYAYHVPSVDAYMSFPRTFRTFVLFGGDGTRPPLCRDRGRCWYYALSNKSGFRGLDTSAYAVVTESVESCDRAQLDTSRTAYLIPRLIDCRCDKSIAIGVHPDTVELLAGIENVPVVVPDDAGRCAVYVTCVSNEGAELCMASGGVVVCKAHRAVQDGINGFLSGGEDARSAVQRALTSDRRAVGAAAGRISLLHGEETHRWLWRGILQGADPTHTRCPADAVLLHQRFLIRAASLRFREIVRSRAADVGRKAIVFVDNRPDPGTALAVLISLCNLRSGWSIVGLVTDDSRGYFESVLGPAGDVHLINMHGYRSKKYFIEQYNDRMKRLETWLAIAARADTALMVQSDGLLVRSGLEEHECMRREYCGAPWKSNSYLYEATKGNMVGNGGFSLRSVDAMVQVCRSRLRERISVYALAPPMSEAEDVYFARFVGDPCPLEQARAFSMEQFPDANALGYHRFWIYHPVEFTERYFDGLLGHEPVLSPVSLSTSAASLRSSRRSKTIL